MASVALLDCHIDLLTAKLSQNFPEAPPTAICEVAQGNFGFFFKNGRKLIVPRNRPLVLLHNTFSIQGLKRNRDVFSTVCSCHPFMVVLTICFMCITITDSYRFSFICIFLFVRLF